MRRKDAYKPAVAVALLFGVFAALLFAGLPALGTGQCEKFTNHSGHVPAGWTATFIEDGVEYGPVVGPGYLSPKEAGKWNRTWDKAIKCRTVTTTTTTEATTSTTIPDPTTTTTPTEPSTTITPSTTVPDTTSTTLDSSTTTTTLAVTTTAPTTTSTPAGSSSTTVVPDASASWYASGSCYEDGGYIDVEFGDGITAVDVYMWDSITPPADWYQVARWTEPGSYKTPVGSPTVFLLIPVVQTGYSADPAEIEVVVEPCTSQASSTSMPEAPNPPVTVPNDLPVDELPYTGLSITWGILVGAVLIGGGTALVRWVRA